MKTTKLIILNKYPYKESSLIIKGLSPEFGRMDFVIRGAQKISKKKFPVIDLFREVSVEFKTEKEGLQTLYKADLLNAYDTIANYPESYLSACSISSFLLKNTHAMLEEPYVYDGLKNAFSQMAEGERKIPWEAFVKLVYLKAHGFLPETIFESDNEEEEKTQKKIMHRILGFTIGKYPLPELPEDYLHQLSDWTDQLCRYHELEHKEF